MLGIAQNIQGSNRLLSDSIYKGDKEAHYLIVREKKKPSKAETSSSVIKQRKRLLCSMSIQQVISCQTSMRWAKDSTGMHSDSSPGFTCIPSSTITSIITKLRVTEGFGEYTLLNAKARGLHTANADPCSPIPTAASSGKAGIATTGINTRKTKNRNAHFCLA